MAPLMKSVVAAMTLGLSASFSPPAGELSGVVTPLPADVAAMAPTDEVIRDCTINALTAPNAGRL